MRGREGEGGREGKRQREKKKMREGRKAQTLASVVREGKNINLIAAQFSSLAHDGDERKTQSK